MRSLAAREALKRRCRADAGGTSVISLGLGDPTADLADAENRIAALSPRAYYDGKAAPEQGFPADGACEPGDTSNFGLFWCEGILGVPGVLAQPTPGESDEEDDVRRLWTR